VIAKAELEWTPALLRRALEDEKLFDMLRRSVPDGVTDQEIRWRVRCLLAWQPHAPGEPYFCSSCGRPVDKTNDEIIVAGRLDRPDQLRYRAVCRHCASGKNQRSDAGWES